MNPLPHLGDHYLVELSGCRFASINSESDLRQGLVDLVSASGATIIKDIFHSFSPHGVTGVIVIAESHVSIHTWPEHGYAAVDIFTCSSRMNIALIVEALPRLTGAAHSHVRKILRGPHSGDRQDARSSLVPDPKR